MKPDRNKTLVLFSYDWDRIEFRKLSSNWQQLHAGFDLFSFPSKARLAWFDMDRFSRLSALRVSKQGASAVISNHEQFGALCAALVAEKMKWPGTPVEAVLACQHKLYARQVLERVAPEANINFRRLEGAQNGNIPDGLDYPAFVKPVKAAFSVLASSVQSRQDLVDHTRFSWQEIMVLRWLLDPFEKVMRRRLPEAGSALSLMLEDHVRGKQYCLDGYCFEGQVRRLGIVDAIMYPGTDAFMRWDYPSRLPVHLQDQAEDIAARFLQEVGFSHGFFNMEFVVDEDSGQLKVIEFNPRLAAQFTDLYSRVDGRNPHEMALALSHGIDPSSVATREPTSACASSFVYRSFDPNTLISLPSATQQRSFKTAFPDGLLLRFPKSLSQIQRDFKWLGNYRFGIVHLGGENAAELKRRCELASSLLGWTAPYAEHLSKLSGSSDKGDAWTGAMGTENASS